MGWLSDDLCFNILFVLEKGCCVASIISWSSRRHDTGLYDFISDFKALKTFFLSGGSLAYNNFKANVFRIKCRAIPRTWYVLWNYSGSLSQYYLNKGFDSNCIFVIIRFKT